MTAALPLWDTPPTGEARQGSSRECVGRGERLLERFVRLLGDWFALVAERDPGAQGLALCRRVGGGLRIASTSLGKRSHHLKMERGTRAPRSWRSHTIYDAGSARRARCSGGAGAGWGCKPELPRIVSKLIAMFTLNPWDRCQRLDSPDRWADSRRSVFSERPRLLFLRLRSNPDCLTQFCSQWSALPVPASNACLACLG
jgi:hypothetical protein